MASSTLNLQLHKKRKPSLSRTIFIIVMVAWPLIQFLVFWAYVNVDTVVMSFQKLDYFSGKELFVGLDNFKWVWDSLTDEVQPFLKNSIINSILLFLSNNFVLLPISIFFAYIMQKKVWGTKVFRVIFFLPNIISIVVLTMAFRFMFDSSFGPINYLLRGIGLEKLIPANGWLGDKSTALIMVLVYCLWAGIGYNVVLLSGSMNRIPPEIYEAARLDGVGVGRELTQIVVPMISGTITTLFVSGISVIFTLFLQPMLLTNGGPYNGLSSTIAFFIVNTINAGDLYHAAATGLVFSIIGIPIIQLIKWGIEKLLPVVEY